MSGRTFQIRVFESEEDVLAMATEQPEAAARMIVAMSAEIVQLRTTLAVTYDTLSAVQMVTKPGSDPYPWSGGALRNQIATDAAAIEDVLGMAPAEIIAWADTETSEEA